MLHKTASHVGSSDYPARWSCLHLLGCVVLLCLAACGDPEPPPEAGRTYEVRGEVLGSRFDGAALRIRHEEIPGYMEAMTMDFKLKDPASAANLQAGDKIRFRYVVADLDSWIEDIEVLPPDTELRFPAPKMDEHHH